MLSPCWNVDWMNGTFDSTFTLCCIPTIFPSDLSWACGLADSFYGGNKTITKKKAWRAALHHSIEPRVMESSVTTREKGPMKKVIKCHKSRWEVYTVRECPSSAA